MAFPPTVGSGRWRMHCGERPMMDDETARLALQQARVESGRARLLATSVQAAVALVGGGLPCGLVDVG